VPENHFRKSAAALAIEVDVDGLRLHALSLPRRQAAKQPLQANDSRALDSGTVYETAMPALGREAPNLEYDSRR
jgi:hypothetical protein